MQQPYVGRFAPSPTGPLHAGSLVAAVASYLDARANNGQWLLRIEDVDEGRNVRGADQAIIDLLARLGMRWDGEIVWQSQRKELYLRAAGQLADHIYPCGCNRREIADSRLGTAPDGSAIYPGTCRMALAPGKVMRSLRVRVPEAPYDVIDFEDRIAGHYMQRLSSDSGDFVLKRADGFWAYQLAVVVDDAEQSVTDVVRGADLIDSTPRQIFLQRLLGVPTPRYMHVPVVRNADGEKLSKQTAAAAITADSEDDALAALERSMAFLGFGKVGAASLPAFWEQAAAMWAQRYPLPTS